MSVVVWSAEEVAGGAGPAELRTVLAWAKDYLVSPHDELGRSGPVCPYTAPSLRNELFHLATTDSPDPAATVAALRAWYTSRVAGLSDADQELLTLLVVLPDLDPTDSTELDRIQRAAKDEFVADGLMIGQFHPACDEPGLWNPRFRPLRSPLPLLAVRKMLVFDFLFVADHSGHADSYLRRFAPDIPARVRDQITTRLVSSGLMSTDYAEAIAS